MMFYIGLVFTLFFGGVGVVIYKRNNVASLLCDVVCLQKMKKNEKSDREQGFFIMEEDVVMVHTKEQMDVF